MKTIIVPTGFTADNEHTVQFAADMAMHIQATLLLLHVYQLPVSITEVPASFLTLDQIKETTAERLAAQKKAIERHVNNSIEVVTEARAGNIADELQKICATVHPFAVVMGCSQSGKLERMFFGSASLSAIHHLETPVFLIPPGASFHPVKRIGLAYDFDHDMPETPQQEIRSMLKEFNAELHVLNVHNSGGLTPENRRHTFLLHKAIADLHPQYHVIDRRNVEEGLNELVQQYGIDFMIIIPRKHALLEALFRKSHADQVALHAQVPLMAIHHE